MAMNFYFGTKENIKAKRWEGRNFGLPLLHFPCINSSIKMQLLFSVYFFCTWIVSIWCDLLILIYSKVLFIPKKDWSPSTSSGLYQHVLIEERDENRSILAEHKAEIYRGIMRRKNRTEKPTNIISKRNVIIHDSSTT